VVTRHTPEHDLPHMPRGGEVGGPVAPLGLLHQRRIRAEDALRPAEPDRRSCAASSGWASRLLPNCCQE
jgi:hypothetical protein